jgi:hypothetical protein
MAILAITRIRNFHESGVAFGSKQVNYEEWRSLSWPLTQEVEKLFYEKSDLELHHISFETLEQFSS